MKLDPLFLHLSNLLVHDRFLHDVPDFLVILGTDFPVLIESSEESRYQIHDKMFDSSIPSTSSPAASKASAHCCVISISSYSVCVVFFNPGSVK